MPPAPVLLEVVYNAATFHHHSTLGEHLRVNVSKPRAILVTGGLEHHESKCERRFVERNLVTAPYIAFIDKLMAEGQFRAPVT